MFQEIVYLSQTIMVESSAITQWFITPLPVVDMTPIFLFTLTGLCAFIALAIAKWVVS